MKNEIAFDLHGIAYIVDVKSTITWLCIETIENETI
jgi:hypothetical protein